jgi:hypothetical protein
MVSPSSRMNRSIANRVIALGLETDILDHSGACAAEPAVPVILQIVPALDTGGAERTTIDIARALKGRLTALGDARRSARAGRAGASDPDARGSRVRGRFGRMRRRSCD